MADSKHLVNFTGVQQLEPKTSGNLIFTFLKLSTCYESTCCPYFHRQWYYCLWLFRIVSFLWKNFRKHERREKTLSGVNKSQNICQSSLLSLHHSSSPPIVYLTGKTTTYTRTLYLRYVFLLNDLRSNRQWPSASEFITAAQTRTGWAIAHAFQKPPVRLIPKWNPCVLCAFGSLYKYEDYWLLFMVTHIGRGTARAAPSSLNRVHSIKEE